MSRTARQAARRADFGAIAARGGPGDWSAAGLRARCAGLRLVLPGRGVAEAALDAWWPGGDDNPRGGGAWVRCFARYSALAAEAGRGGGAGSGGGAAGRTTADQALRTALAAALSDRPEAVALSSGTTVYVHPKSYVALEYCTALDVAVRCLQAAADQLLAPVAAVHVPVLRALAVRGWVWVVTHNAAGLPFDPHAPDTPLPPAWTCDVAPSDLFALTVAYQRVNAERLRVLGEAFPRDGTPSALGFEGFLGTYAGAKHLDPLQVLHAWSAGRVTAVAVSEAIAHADAMASNKRPGA